MTDAHQVIQKNAFQIAILPILFRITDVDEINVQSQVRQIAALGELILSGLPHQLIALFFGERLDVRYWLVIILLIVSV